MTKDALRIDGLEKRYGAQLVLQGLNLRVQRGEIFALLGVNGAGKTTALECVEGLRRYDAGHIAVSGRLGIQPQAAALPAHIRPLEAVRLFAKWNRAKPDSALLAALGIDALAKKQYAQLSMGQKRRLHLALARYRRPGYRLPRRTHCRARCGGPPVAARPHPPAQGSGQDRHPSQPRYGGG